MWGGNSNSVGWEQRTQYSVDRKYFNHTKSIQSSNFSSSRGGRYSGSDGGSSGGSNGTYSGNRSGSSGSSSLSSGSNKTK